MLKRLLRAPSPSLAVSIAALVLAAGAGTFAFAALTSKDVKRIATNAAKQQVKLHAQAPLKGDCQPANAAGLPTGIEAIAKNGSVTCGRGSVTPLTLSISAGGAHQLQAGDLQITDFCRDPTVNDTKIEFKNLGAAGSLNYGYIDGVNNDHANGTAMPATATVDIPFNGGGRIEGQFIYSTFDNATSEGQETTVSLHAVDNVSSCEVSGTVQTSTYHD